MGLFSRKSSIEHRLRSGRPQPSDELMRSIKGDLESSARPSRGSVRPQFRLVGASAAAVVGLLVIGGAGFAMSGGVDVITGISHGSITHTRTVVNTVVLNAANDQYGTTTTQTTVTTTAAPATTTTSNGTQSTSVKTGSAGGLTVSPGNSGSQQTSVNWSSGTFSTPVSVTVNPAPPVAQSAFTGPAAQQIVQITVTDANGNAVHHLSAPLEIVFANAPDGYVPAFSEDGVSYTAATPIASAADYTGGIAYYRVGNDVHVLTDSLTSFAVLYKANLSKSESGRPFAPAGSGKFGDPTRTHTGAPNVDIPAAATISGNRINFSFFVDEQVAVYMQVVSDGNESVIGSHSTIRKHTIGGKSRKSMHLVILRPGTINMSLKLPGGIKPGSTVQLTFVDFDGNIVKKTVTIS